MTTDRPYRSARPTQWALDELRAGAGTQFDPAVVDVVARLTEAEPTPHQAQQPGRAPAATLQPA